MPSSPIPNEIPIELWYGARKHSPPDASEIPSALPANGEPGAAMRIAIQGEPGSFSHEAAIKLVAGATIVPCSLSADAFSALSNGSVDAAVIPVTDWTTEKFNAFMASEVARWTPLVKSIGVRLD